ncbi:ubiquitin-conjugating enzyme E2 G2-like [Patiria miniata]|uniref:Ubiquitin-conjugating enzyme E2 G2 n=1 Tax=Patiria miniata TaxID=46514 RepID=A0A913ZAG2_PATMI|nr:ubiquitin-conjugating enzyme E2 G2-like [Patiria miniata]
MLMRRSGLPPCDQCVYVLICVICAASSVVEEVTRSCQISPHFYTTITMAGAALKRLMTEYKQLTLNPPEGIVAGPLNEDNFFEWEATISGPEGTCFEGGVFEAQILFPPDYPLNPPKMKFKSEMFHPNIYADGRVCISILHAPGDDPMGYESSAERWSPVQSVEKILLSVVSMLAEPNDESGANVDASKMWRDEREKFNQIAEGIVRKSLGLPPAPS